MGRLSRVASLPRAFPCKSGNRFWRIPKRRFATERLLNLNGKEKNVKENYKDFTWHSRETVAWQYPLTDEEKIELGEKMANAKAEMARLEFELSTLKKNYKEQIDKYACELSEAAVKFNSGLADPADVECDVYQDFENFEMVYVTVEDDVELIRRPMLDKEKRPSLLSMVNYESASANISPFPK